MIDAGSIRMRGAGWAGTLIVTAFVGLFPGCSAPTTPSAAVVSPHVPIPVVDNSAKTALTVRVLERGTELPLSEVLVLRDDDVVGRLFPVCPAIFLPTASGHAAQHSCSGVITSPDSLSPRMSLLARSMVGMFLVLSRRVGRGGVNGFPAVATPWPGQALCRVCGVLGSLGSLGS